MKGEKVLLRAMEPYDVDLLYDWENDSNNWRVSNTLAPFSKHILHEYVLSTQDIYSARQLRLIIQEIETSTAVGCIDLFDFDPLHQRAGVGILVAKEKDRQNGFASEALELMIHHAFTAIDCHQLYCNVAVTNTASIKLFEKNGFEVCGTKKQWIKGAESWVDEHMMQLINAG